MATPRNPLESFIWGEGGAALTPEEIASRRKIEAALAGKIDTSPVGHWTQGLARVADAFAGAVRRGQLNSAEKETRAAGSADYDAAVKALTGGSSASTSAPAAGSPRVSSIPMTGAAGEVSGTSPRVATAGVSALPDATELNAYLADESRRATLPAGMRNNNPGNIKFVGQKVPGIVGPSVNTDQGDPQAVFDTPESGMRAMHSLLLKKYNGGKLTPNQIIAGNMGWTPGNFQAAANVARYAGIGPDDDIGLNDPTKAAKFMRGLMMQEHGKSSNLYPDSMILSALTNGAPTQVASLDPSAGMPPAAAAIEKAAPQSGYIDPMVSVQPNAAVPALDAPQTVSPAPTVASVPTQEVAQNGQYPTPPAPPSPPAPPQAPSQSPIMNEALLRAISSPYMTEGQRSVVQMLIQQQMAQQQAERERLLKQNDPAYRLGLEKSQLEIENMRNPRLTPGDKLAREKFDWEKQNAGQTADIKEYQYAVDRGYQGSFVDFQLAQKKAGASSVTVNNQDEGEFKKKAAARNVERFGSLADAGTAAAGVAQSMPVMRELLAQAPQGPVQGRLAEMFPGYSSAGDAFMAQVNQIAPTLRVAGSGAMSDRDLDVLMGSLPRLRGNPQANELILNIFEKKSQLNAQRGAIAAQALRGEIDPSEADRQITEIDKVPLLDDRTRSILRPPEAPKPPAPPEQAPEGVDPGLWQYLTPEQKKLWQN